MKQCEYRTVRIDIKGSLTKQIDMEDMARSFDQLGAEGYVLQTSAPVLFNGHTQYILYTFMREK